MNVKIDQDGLPITEVGSWTLEKHERLSRYVTISSGVRKKFARTEATYIELFSGPGRSIVEDNGETIEGSPIIAVRTAQNLRSPYTDVHLADSESLFVDATCQRMATNSERVHSYAGVAETTVDQVIAKLNPYGYHFAFLDPYKLDPLPFVTIKKLAALSRIDMLIHVSIHDFQRNLRLYMKEQNGTLDRFAPGWRDVVDERETDRKVRAAIFHHWLTLIRGLDMAPSKGVERVVGSNQQPLYWLVLVSRHKKAQEFWDKIRNVSSQTRLDV